MPGPVVGEAHGIAVEGIAVVEPDIHRGDGGRGPLIQREILADHPVEGGGVIAPRHRGVDKVRSCGCTHQCGTTKTVQIGAEHQVLVGVLDRAPRDPHARSGMQCCGDIRRGGGDGIGPDKRDTVGVLTITDGEGNGDAGRGSEEIGSQQGVAVQPAVIAGVERATGAGIVLPGIHAEGDGRRVRVGPHHEYLIVERGDIAVEIAGKAPAREVQPGIVGDFDKGRILLLADLVAA